MLDFNEYQHQAREFRTSSANAVYAMYGLSGEVGELHSLIAKLIRDSTPAVGELRDPITKELGDILWFISAIADDWGVPLEEIAQGNLTKLAGRKERGTIGGSGDDR